MSMTKAKFDSALASIKKRGTKVTNEFTAIVREGINLYYGETNRNIQVINDLVDCANSLKGLRVKALVEYLSQVIPHANDGAKASHHFGKMQKEKKAAMDSTWKDFLVEYPEWHSYTVEKDPTPFDLTVFMKTIHQRIEKAYKEGKLDEEGLKTFRKDMSNLTIQGDKDDRPNL